MRNPNNVLNSLTEHSINKDYKYQRLYRLLFNSELYFIAYQKIYAKEGNMTRGSDNRTIDNTWLCFFNSVEQEKDFIKNILKWVRNLQFYQLK